MGVYIGYILVIKGHIGFRVFKNIMVLVTGWVLPPAL